MLCTLESTENVRPLEKFSICVLSERTCVFSGILFTKHLIEIIFVETNQLLGSNPWSWRSKPAALRKQTPGASILIFSTNLVNVHHIKMLRRIRSRSLHDFDACKEHAAAQCQHPTNIVANDVFDSDSIFFIFVFLVAKPQLNYWTQWMVRTQLIIRKLRLYIHVG